MRQRRHRAARAPRSRAISRRRSNAHCIARRPKASPIRSRSRRASTRRACWCVDGMHPRHAAEFRRCLAELDVQTARRLWQHVHPGWPQPESDYEMLVTLHAARLQSINVSTRAKNYSRRWLQEREVGITQKGVGVAIKAPRHRARRALAIREAMEDAVYRSIKAGIDIDDEAIEVRRRIIEARDKEMGITGPMSGRRR